MIWNHSPIVAGDIAVKDIATSIRAEKLAVCSTGQLPNRPNEGSEEARDHQVLTIFAFYRARGPAEV